MDHVVASAEQYFKDEEAANEGMCFAAAEQHGVAEKAMSCDDGELSCPNCPWKKVAGKWKPQ